MCSDALTGQVRELLQMPAQEAARLLLGLVNRRVGSHVAEAGHPRLSALEVTGVDPVHGRLDGGQIGFQRLKFDVVSFGCRAGRRHNRSDVRVCHAGESTVDRCLPR